MYLVDVEGLIEESECLSDLLDDISRISSEIHEQMREDESLWIFSPSEYREEGYWPVGMAVSDTLQNEQSFVLKNVISRVKEHQQEPHFADISEEIFFLVKDKREYHFNKDEIRVEHVYEDNEWTDRTIGNSSYHDYESRRYNPKGKDPGNVWLREIRSQTADATVDQTRPLSRQEAVRRCVRVGAKEDEVVIAIGFNSSTIDAIEAENRNLEVSDWDTFRGEGA